MAQINLNIKLNTTEAINGLNSLKNNISQIAQAIEKINIPANLSSSADTLSDKYSSLLSLTKKLSQEEENRSALSEKNALANIKSAENEAQKRTKAINSISRSSSNYTKISDQLTNSLKLRSDVLSNLNNNVLKLSHTEISVMKFLNLIKNAISQINTTLVETENKIVAIKRVLPSGSASNSEISDKLFEIAQTYGQSIENVSSVMQEFAKAGYDWQKSVKATEATIVALNVAELDAEEATSGLISIMSQYGKTSDDIMEIIDAVNKVSDSFPTSCDDIIAALKLTGSTAKNANVDLESTIGLIASLSQSTGKSGNNIGTALNSLFQYSSTSESLELFSKLSEEAKNAVEAFKEGESIIPVWEEVSRVIKNLSAEDLNTFSEQAKKLAEDSNSEISDLFELTNEVYGVAGTYRKNYFISLLENMESAADATQSALNSEGYSLKENSAYMETYTAKVNALKAQWQSIANDEEGLLKFKKNLADIGSAGLNIIEWAGGLRTVFVGLGIAAIGAFGPSLISSIEKTISLLKGATTGARQFQISMGWISLAATAISAFTYRISENSKSQSEARKETIEHWKAQKEQQETLGKLIEKYEGATEKSENFYEIEEEIVNLLGEKSSALDGLTKKTEEYTSAVKKLTEAEKNEYRKEVTKALSAAKEELIKNTDELPEYITDNFQSLQILSKAGVNYYADTGAGNYTRGYKLRNYVSRSESSSLSDESKAIIAQANYELYNQASENLWKYYQSVKNDSENSAEYIKQVENLWTWFDDAVNSYKPYVDNYVNAKNALKELDSPSEQSTTATQTDNVQESVPTVLKIGSSGIFNEISSEELKKFTEAEKGLKIFAQAFGEISENGIISNSTLSELLDLNDDSFKIDKLSNKVSEDYLGNLAFKYLFDTIPSDLIYSKKDFFKSVLEESGVSNIDELMETVFPSNSAYINNPPATPLKFAAASNETDNYASQDSTLKKYENETELLKQSLTLMENQGESIEKRIDTMRKIQSVLHEEAEYMRSVGEEQSEINALSIEWWNIENDVNGLLENEIDSITEKFEKEKDFLNSEYELLEDEKIPFSQKVKKLNEIALLYAKYIGNMRKAGAEQTKLNQLTAQQKDIYEKIDELFSEHYEEIAEKVTTVKEAETEALQRQIDSLISLRDIERETLDTEEKKLAVIKAQKALQDAQKERVLRIYNEDTGMFEWHADEKSVQEAKENLNNAQKDLNSAYIEQQINSLETKKSQREAEWQELTGTNGIDRQKITDFMQKNSIAWHNANDDDKKILESTNSALGSIFNLVKKDGVWYDQSGNRVYDSGGIIKGIGGIKATPDDETVLPPDITKKLIEPVSNENFHRFCQDLGLIFEKSMSWEKERPISSDIRNYNNTGNTVENSNNNNYYINGIPISSDTAKTHTISDLFKAMPLVKNI